MEQENSTKQPARPHTITLRFGPGEEDQALYEAIKASSERDHRTPLSWQVKYLLQIVLGLRKPDRETQKRLGIVPWDTLDLAKLAGSMAYILEAVIMKELEEAKSAGVAGTAVKPDHRVLELVC